MTINDSHNCLYCSKNTRNNKFCSRSCAAKYNNAHRDKKHREKQRISIKQSLSLTQILKKSDNCKIYFCKACGKIHKSNNDRNLCECGLSTKFQSFKGLNKYFGLNLENLGSIKFLEDFDACRKYAELLYETNSLQSLAKIINHPDTIGGNVAKLLTYLGIKIRSQSDAQKLSLLQNRSIPNESPRRFYKSGNFLYNNKNYFYRSSYELEFAKQLMSKEISFAMESLRISYFDTVQSKFSVAIPDFTTSTFIFEIKSNYTFEEQNMIDKFNAYIQLGYSPFLILEKQCMYLNGNHFEVCELPI